MKTLPLIPIGMLAFMLASCQIPSVDQSPIYGKAHNVFSVDEQVLGKSYTYRQGFGWGNIVLVRFDGEIILTTHPKWFRDVIKWDQPVREFAGMSPAQAVSSGHFGLIIVDKDKPTEHVSAVFIHHRSRMPRFL